LLSKIKGYREQGKSIVFTNGCFDVIHAGHIKLLKSAKTHGDLLIVGLNNDKSIATLKGENRPYHSMRDRINVLEQMECVDHIVTFSATTPLELIKKIKPNVLIKGGEYQLERIVGSSFVKSYGGDVKTIKMHKKLSTTDAGTYL
jgi:D-beta-D-heptose 7-phosphate kinase/D-beta-D-heptose 1-phosphate adenosyltransferase